MQTVRFRTILALLTTCGVLTGITASSSWADAGSQTQLIDVSHQLSDLQNQIKPGQQFKQGQLSTGASCGYGTAAQPFAPFGDSSSYALATGSNLTAWTLDHAAISNDHDATTGAQNSVSLPGNGKATTPPICIGAANTAVRLMVKNNGAANSDLKVDLLYENPDGSIHTLTLAKLAGGATWAPSVSIPLGINALAPAYPNGVAIVELRFQPEGLGGSDTWSVENVYVASSGAGQTTPPAGSGTATPSSTVTSQQSSSTVDSSQLIDVSHQVADIQKKISDLTAKGQSAKLGKLSLAADCGYQNPSRVFLPWGDLASYALAPGGDLSNTGGWTFKDAVLGSDHDPYTVGTGSLGFAKGGAQAVTPAMCVDLTNPTIRFFAKDTGGNGKANLKVTVLYEDVNGNIQHLDLARVKASTNWSPSITIPIGVNVLATASASGVTAVAFQFTVDGLQKGETLSIDNLYVDPFCSR